MEKAKGSASFETEIGHEEHAFFTYDPNEQEEIRVNKANASHIFHPEFVPFKPRIQKEYDLSILETLIYGFINFYTQMASERFYFTNKQLSDLFGVSENTITTSVKNLRLRGLIDTKYRVRSGGGEIRFIEPNIKSKITKSSQNLGSTTQKIGEK